MHLPVEQKDTKRLHKRYQKHRRSLSTFLDYPELAPDNNSSERALRSTATYRKVTGGFRPTWGADLYAVVRSRVDATSKSAINPFATNAFKKMLKKACFNPLKEHTIECAPNQLSESLCRSRWSQKAAR